MTDSSCTALFLTGRPVQRIPAVAPPKVQAVLQMDTKAKKNRSVQEGTPGHTGAGGLTLAGGQVVLTEVVAEQPTNQTNGQGPSVNMTPAASLPNPTVRVGQSTHKARPLAMTHFMEDVRASIQDGSMNRESALVFALQGIAETDSLALHTLSKTMAAMETVVNDGIWTPLEDIFNLPPPQAVADYLDVVHTYLMPRDHTHKRLVKKASSLVQRRMKQYNRAMAATVTGGPSSTGAAAPMLGMNLGVWGANQGSSW